MNNVNEHEINLNTMLKNLNNINTILDAGSGRTSLNFLCDKFYPAVVDAIVYPDDLRKINSIKTNVTKNNYNLIELDICKQKIVKNYDLVVAHLLLGEAIKFGNDVQNLLKRLLEIKSKYYLIYDFLEDNTINYEYIENYLLLNKFKILKKYIFLKNEEQQFSNFLGKNYIAYLSTINLF